MPRQFSSEFRQRALDRIDAGHSVTSVAHDLEISAQSLYTWRKQHRIDMGELAGSTTLESSELRSAKREIVRLTAELAVTRRANELLKEAASPKDGSRRSL